MGSDGLGTKAEEGSQDPRLRRQDSLISLPDPAVALLWNHDHEIFFYLHKYCVFLVFAFFCTGVRVSDTIPCHQFITKEPPEILTSHPHTFSRIYASSISISQSRGSSVWRFVILPVVSCVHDFTLHIFLGSASSCSPFY